MNSESTSLIVGLGQDGKLLLDLLLSNSVDVICATRTAILYYKPSTHQLPQPVLISSTPLLGSTDNISLVFTEYNISSVYYLPAYHGSSQSISKNNIDTYSISLDTHLNYFAELIFYCASGGLSPKFFYAGSSLVYSGSDQYIRESTTFSPSCLYGLTKSFGIEFCDFARATLGFRIVTGILFTHESHYRGSSFLLPKIIKSAIAHSTNRLTKPLVVASLDAAIDFCYARDLIKSVFLLMESTFNGRIVIASGAQVSIFDIVRYIYSIFDLDYSDFVTIDPSVITRPYQKRIASISLLTHLGFLDTTRDYKSSLRLLVNDFLDASPLV